MGSSTMRSGDCGSVSMAAGRRSEERADEELVSLVCRRERKTSTVGTRSWGLSGVEVRDGCGVVTTNTLRPSRKMLHSSGMLSSTRASGRFLDS
jgi:hypothetical protein